MSGDGRSGNGALSGLSTDELRAAVRAVLRDVLPAAVTDRGPATAASAPSPEAVVLRTDADLDAFVRRVASLCAYAGRRSALQDGRHGFRLATGTAAAPGAPAPVPPGDVIRVERGAVTERTVKAAAAARARLVLGRGAVLTPLARDRARSMGVLVEREPVDRARGERTH